MVAAITDTANTVSKESADIVKDVSTDLSTDTSTEGDDHFDKTLDVTLETADDTVDLDELWTNESPVLDNELDAALKDVLTTPNDGEGEDESVVSDLKDHTNDDDSVSMSSMNSSMSAVQLRLENRKKAKQLQKFQSQEELKAKLASMNRKIDAATLRRERSLRAVIEKASSHQNAVKDVSSRIDQQHEEKVESLQEKHQKKMALASERKELLDKSASFRIQSKMEKVSSKRIALDEETNARTEALHEKHERKMALANERKESIIQDISSKIQSKMEQVTNVITKVDKEHETRAESIQEKHEKRMTLATERKENLIQDISSKIKSKMAKITSIDAEKEAKTESSRERIDQRMMKAAERKDSFIKKISTRASAYVSSATERGQEAKKNRDSDGNSVASFESEIRAVGSSGFSLASIREDSVLDDSMQRQIDSSPPPSVAEGSFADDSSVSSTSSNKSKVQLRLEQWERKVPTKESLQSKLDAAAKRRETSLLETRNKTGYQLKMEKVASVKDSIEKAAEELKSKVSEKMMSASQRKEALIAAKNSEALKAAKVAALKKEKREQLASIEKKLGDKLLSAIERKDNIIAARSAKAGKRVSTTSIGGLQAMKKREELVNKIISKSENKTQSAAKKRKNLRELEKKKREVMKLRRDMVLAMKNDSELTKIQEKLKGKMVSAAERKENILAAKAARAAGHLNETTERGQEALRRREALTLEKKAISERKLENASERKNEILKSEHEKREKRNLKRNRGREIAKQKKSEQQMIDGWEGRPSMDEDDKSTADDSVVKHEMNDVPLGLEADEQSQGDLSVASNRKLAAKKLLMKEIQLANEAKYREMARITRERKEALEKPRPVSASHSIGTIDTNDAFSHTEDDVSISGLSTVIKEEKSRGEIRRQKAALAIAELDIKLSEIQIMQAIILAEEASLKGDDSFTTKDKIDDLDRVNVSVSLERETTGGKLKKRAHNFFAYSMKQAKVAKERANQTIKDMKRQAQKVELIDARKKKEADRRNQLSEEVLV